MRFSKIFWAAQVFRTILKQKKTIQIKLTNDEAGRSISTYMNSRRLIWKRKDFLCVLELPSKFEIYLRGRSRQALRTNLHKAHAVGLRTELIENNNVADTVAKAISNKVNIKFIFSIRNESVRPHIKTWACYDKDDNIVGFSRIYIDRYVALITYLNVIEQKSSTARWLISRAIFEYCIENGIKYLVCDSVFDVNSGNRYFQERLGFDLYKVLVEIEN